MASAIFLHMAQREDEDEDHSEAAVLREILKTTTVEEFMRAVDKVKKDCLRQDADNGKEAINLPYIMDS